MTEHDAYARTAVRSGSPAAARLPAGRTDSLPRTAALHWFGAGYLLILGMSFLILPRGPIHPLYGLIWLRGPLLAASGLALLWLCELRLSRRADVTMHVLAAVPPVAVGVWYVYLSNYGPAVTLCVLGLAIAISPLLPRTPMTSRWRPDLLGLALGVSLAAQGADLLIRSEPPVIPYGVQTELAVLFVVFGIAVAASHLTRRTPFAVAWVVHVGAGASLFALNVILAVGISQILWVLDASGLLLAFTLVALPWLSARMVRVEADTVRARLALALFSGSLVTLLIAVPIVVAVSEPEGAVAISARQTAFGVTLALSIAAAAVGWALARQLVVPLARLVAGVERIAAGERPVALQSGAPSEVEELAVAVESMADKIDEHAAREERTRLARDLHDSITQALFAAALKAEVLAENGSLAEEPARTAVELRRLTRGALAQMRTMLFELRSERHEYASIDYLLRNVVEATEARTSVTVDLRIDGGGAPPRELHAVIYRVSQEALNNVARHAKASHAEVRLDANDDGVLLLIRDDGCGFEPGADQPGHYGLRSMRERAAEAGAALRVVSAPGEGTLVVLEWRPDGAPV